jgi:low affinity Fe/Cu permease
MTIGTILLILLILFLVGALPTWPYSRKWGYYPSSGLAVIVLILLILVLTKRL